MSTYIDIHIIQDIPPSCVNRDDSGSPKSAVYGGVRRMRVSSQSWKRATRQHFIDHLDQRDLGTRTKRVCEFLAHEITEQAEDLTEQANDMAEEVFHAAKIKLSVPKSKKDETEEKLKESGYLIFLSHRQIQQLAELAIESVRSDEPLDKKAVKTVFQSENSIDVALFGRMVADDTDLNVDAACQVAHAISTHAAENEYDFFTAVDDYKAASDEEDAGAGMMGTVEFSSATVYRYATVNLDMLRENLGDNEATLRALGAFIDGFATSMPTGKQNTFANRTLPHTIVVSIRNDQPISFVGAFEKPIQRDEVGGRGYVERSVDALASYATTVIENYGSPAERSVVVSLDTDKSSSVKALGERVTFAELAQTVQDEVATHMPAGEQE